MSLSKTSPIIIQGVWKANGKLREKGLSILLVEQNASLAVRALEACFRVKFASK